MKLVEIDGVDAEASPAGVALGVDLRRTRVAAERLGTATQGDVELAATYRAVAAPVQAHHAALAGDEAAAVARLRGANTPEERAALMAAQKPGAG